MPEVFPYSRALYAFYTCCRHAVADRCTVARTKPNEAEAIIGWVLLRVTIPRLQTEFSYQEADSMYSELLTLRPTTNNG